MRAIREAIPLLGDPAVEEWCGRFADYLEETWIRGMALCVCLFVCLSFFVCLGQHPPQEWNQYEDLELNFLTNNVIEGMNFRLITR